MEVPDMASTAHDYYLGWLRDAHAMEKQALIMLDAQEPRMADYPEVQARIRLHRQETEIQLSDIQALLDRHDADGSMIKDLAAQAMAGSQALGGMLASDEPVKAALMSFTFEQMEIASYLSLIATAEVVGDTAAIPVLRRILDEEIEMADWLEENLDEVTRLFLAQADAEAGEPQRASAF
jgi:ferritin-like metal-binding protein YciE